jgi:uncharacterized protein YjbI with pentapeptide repeats
MENFPWDQIVNVLRNLAEDSQREAALQTYLDRMSELLIDKNLRTADEGSVQQVVARARTLTVLDRLDPNRRGAVLQFLHESSLVSGTKPTVRLEGANLEGADLGGADLEGANLQAANLQGAHLEGAILEGAILEGANLQGANLQGAHLRDAYLGDDILPGASLQRANLEGANLEGANLGGAHLQGAHLQGAHLQGAHLQGAILDEHARNGANLTREQLNQVRIVTGTPESQP